MSTMTMERRESFGWPATSGGGYANPTLGTVAHYDGSNQRLASRGHAACRAYWKATRIFHMVTRGWSDIGYAWGCCPHGVVFEGRGLNRAQAAQPGGNTTWYSVTFMSGPDEAPTADQLRAFRQLRAYLMNRGVRGTVSYHGRFISTSCAGPIINGLVSSGAIVKGDTTGGGTPPPATGDRVLGVGDSGSDVLAVQAQLVYLGYDLGTWGADGRFGEMTEDAVLAFQRAEGIGVDGRVGDETRAALNAAVEREREDVPEHTLYTTTSGYEQEIPPREWTTLRFDRRYDGSKWEEKAAEPSFVFGPCYYTAGVGVRAKGLETGQELQVRVAYYREAEGGGWERYASMPINSPTHDAGSSHQTYAWPGHLGSSRRARARVEVIHYGAEPVVIDWARAESLYWKV